MVSAVIDNIAAGVPRDEILRSYPTLTEADIDAALAYAAELPREGTVDLTGGGSTTRNSGLSVGLCAPSMKK